MHAAAAANAPTTDDAPTDQETDRRADQRRRAFASGTVILDNRMSTFDVVVRNRSGAGFLLKAENTALIPNEFSLRLPGEPGEYRCAVVRRSQNALGIKVIGFVDGNRASPKPDRPIDPQADLRARLAERFPHLAKD